MSELSLSAIRNRHEMIRYFDGYSSDRMEELDERRLKSPLVKTHLLEFMGGGHHGTDVDLADTFQRRGATLRPVDDDLFLVSDGTVGDIGFVERLRPRLVALYSTRKVPEPEDWVRRLVQRSPEIDHVWLSGLTFNVLWRTIARLSKPHRHTKIAFRHESLFELAPREMDVDERAGREAADEPSEDSEVIEQRGTSFRLHDRVGVIDEKLKLLQEVYSPLYAISQLRFPSPVSTGGHDFYDNGKVTNRSGSFRDHRSHVLFVARMYEQLLEATEEQAWYSIRESLGVPGQFNRVVGAPVVIRFKEKLPEPVFEHWVRGTFGSRGNRFRLWGHPIRLGRTKAHVYGVDVSGQYLLGGLNDPAGSGPSPHRSGRKKLRLSVRRCDSC